MTTTEDYREHTISATALPNADGSFGWHYFIDGEGPTRSRGRPRPSEALAIADSLGYAKAQIDAFIWTETRAS